MAEIWLTADSHCFHDRVIEFCQRKRPDGTLFGSADEMNEQILSEHNAVVRGGDEVYNLGDFLFRAQQNTAEKAAFVKRFNGQIRLVEGNHDHARRWPPELKQAFVWIRDRYMIKVDRDHGRVFMVLDHFPLRDWDRRSHGALHAHGHWHGDDHHNPGHHPPAPGSFDVGVDVAHRITGQYRPFHIDEVIAHIGRGFVPASAVNGHVS